jgi:hypothetical protein
MNSEDMSGLLFSRYFPFLFHIKFYTKYKVVTCLTHPSFEHCLNSVFIWKRYVGTCVAETQTEDFFLNSFISNQDYLDSIS